ncbi:hypothetical protein K4A83_13295 [Spirulina subsalsa FACHB-351]|uniref:Uncharacterized protein n=1 Tax=Spirulina subsalsa FACHB-351 TaxID=234711 RepID=A0ABT3L6V8_9CYAN|nr:mS29 family ribosomal protein [Spirulina subsalsa]MCW6037238.1 hypothetical protein [Spirulina subsalsa FACHB-351]
MTGRRILIFVLLVVLAMVAVVLIHGSGSPAGPMLISILLVAVFPIISVAATTRVWWDLIDNFRDDANLRHPAVRFYLYGRGGSGKTTLIKSWLGGEVRPEQATKYFAYYTAEKYLDLETKRRCRVVISDYQGQSPSQNTLNASPKVIGPPGQRVVNGVYFIVDIAPRIEKNGRPLDTYELIEWLSVDTEMKIRKRVEQHLEYIVPAILEIVFSTVYSHHLISTTLVINKIDLLEKVVAMGCIPGVSLASVDEYARNLFRRIEYNIREACDKVTSPDHNIEFSVVLVSASNGTGVSRIFNDTIKRYSDMNIKIEVK